MNIHTTLTNTTDAMAIGGAISAVTFWGLSISELGVIVSTIVAVLSLVLRSWVTFRQERRAHKEHIAKLEKIYAEPEADGSSDSGSS